MTTVPVPPRAPIRLGTATDRYTRRDFLGTGLAAAGMVLLIGCAPSTPTNPGGSGWTFTDDTGDRVSLAQRPRTVLCYLNLAAALWDNGYRATGSYQALTTPSPGDHSISGDLDQGAVESFGDIWGQLNLEKVAAAQVDLVIVGVMRGKPLLTDDNLAAVARIAPTVKMEMYANPLTHTIRRVSELDTALGASPNPANRESDYDRESTRLREAIARTAGLRTAFVAARTESLIFDRRAYPLVGVAQDMGLTVVDAGDQKGTPYAAPVSWENAARYPADLLLLDRRPYSLKPAALTKNTVWMSLPAVQRGQVGDWNPEPVLSWKGMSSELSTLARTIGQSQRL